MVISESVTSIASYAFRNCISLEKITIPKNVAYIPYYVFSGCTSLIEITIPERVNFIEHSVFANCTSLQKVYVHKDCSINSTAFENCNPDLEIIYYE